MRQAIIMIKKTKQVAKILSQLLLQLKKKGEVLLLVKRACNQSLARADLVKEMIYMMISLKNLRKFLKVTQKL
jgi:hypothetical protein